MRDTESKSDLNLVFLPKITWKIGKDEFQGNSSDKYLAYEFHRGEEGWEVEKPPGHSKHATGVLRCVTLTQDHTASQVTRGPVHHSPFQEARQRQLCVCQQARGAPRTDVSHHPCIERAIPQAGTTALRSFRFYKIPRQFTLIFPSTIQGTREVIILQLMLGGRGGTK